MSGVDEEFQGDALVDLVCGIEAAIGRRLAGNTPLARAVTDLCEDAIKRDNNRFAADLVNALCAPKPL